VALVTIDDQVRWACELARLDGASEWGWYEVYTAVREHYGVTLSTLDAMALVVAVRAVLHERATT
jgi:hypothetical protein